MDDLRPPRDDSPAEPSPDTSLPDVPLPSSDPIVSWAPPGESAAGRADLGAPIAVRPLEVRAAFDRTIDTFLANWPVFMLLSAPLALLGVVLSLLPPSGDPADPFAYLRGLGVVIAAVNAFTSVSTLLAVDDAMAGRPVSFGRAAERSARPTVIAVFSSFIVGLCVLGLLVLPAIVGLIAGGFIAVALIGAGLLLTLYAVFRWWLGTAAIALDNAGPLKALGRSWLVTKGNLWSIGLAALAVFLVVAPWTAAGLLFELAGYSGAGIAIGVGGTLVVGPLAFILPGVLYGDLTGRWEATPAPAGVAQATGPVADGQVPPQFVAAPDVAPAEPGVQPVRPTPEPAPPLPATPTRRGYLAVVAILGAVLLVPSVVLAAPVFGDLADLARAGAAAAPVEDRGHVLAGTHASAADPCLPSDLAATFSPDDDIYLGAWLTRPVGPEPTATVHVFFNGDEEFTGALETNSHVIDCYATEALSDLTPGSYRILIDDDDGVLADGTFIVR